MLYYADFSKLQVNFNWVIIRGALGVTRSIEVSSWTRKTKIIPHQYEFFNQIYNVFTPLFYLVNTKIHIYIYNIYIRMIVIFLIISWYLTWHFIYELYEIRCLNFFFLSSSFLSILILSYKNTNNNATWNRTS